jgi:hypothetical protein
MSENGEFKALVRRRMDATGEKYNVAYRALLRAAETAVLPMSGRRILPRIAATSLNGPYDVYVELPQGLGLQLDDDDLARYVAGDEDTREQLVEDRLRDRFEELLADGDLVLGHVVIDIHQAEDEIARTEAAYLGILPDQYLWLEDRLTQEEFEGLSDEAMHRLLADEYHPYQAPGEQ